MQEWTKYIFHENEAKQYHFKKKSNLLRLQLSWPSTVLYLLRCKICDDTSYVGKAKTKFHLRFNNCKSKHWSFRKGKQNVPEKRFNSHYIQDWHRGIDDWEVTLLEKCEIHKQLKEREMFLRHKLKTFYPVGLNEKEEYLF